MVQYVKNPCSIIFSIGPNGPNVDESASTPIEPCYRCETDLERNFKTSCGENCTFVNEQCRTYYSVYRSEVIRFITAQVKTQMITISYSILRDDGNLVFVIKIPQNTNESFNISAFMMTYDAPYTASSYNVIFSLC